jgi:hypothetical protein
LSSDNLVPFRWPAVWTDPALLRLLSGSPINCLLFDGAGGAGAVADAGRRMGLTVLEWSALAAAPLPEIKWDTPAAQTVVTGLVWPRVKLSSMRSASAVDAGPTGAPWIDSNTWIARLTAVRAPGKPIWLGFESGKDDPVPGEGEYRTAIADSAATGARWMISLDDGLRRGLPTGNAEALKTWRGILAALTFFEKHREWSAWDPWGSIGILSTFAGKDEFLGQEVLNLAARRNLLYRVLDRSTRASLKLDGLRGVLYVDNDPPSAGLKVQLDAFARTGGLLIVPRTLAGQFAGGKLASCPVDGYDFRSMGKGWLASATRDWDDPYFLAADAHNLVSPAQRSGPVIQCQFVVGALFRRRGPTPGTAPVGGLHQPSERIGESGAGTALAFSGHVWNRIRDPCHAAAGECGGPDGTPPAYVPVLRSPGVPVLSQRLFVGDTKAGTVQSFLIGPLLPSGCTFGRPGTSGCLYQRKSWWLRESGEGMNRMLLGGTSRTIHRRCGHEG